MIQSKQKNTPPDDIEMMWKTYKSLKFYISMAFCVHTCHKVTKSYGGQGDDHKVQGLERRPTLDVFKDGRWERHEQQAAEQHEQQGGDDTDLCLTDVPVLQQREWKWVIWQWMSTA